jgi:hypothetical protein
MRFCTHEGLPFVLGHALSMQAMYGGKAQNETVCVQYEAHFI